MAVTGRIVLAALLAVCFFADVAQAQRSLKAVEDDLEAVPTSSATTNTLWWMGSGWFGSASCQLNCGHYGTWCGSPKCPCSRPENAAYCAAVTGNPDVCKTRSAQTCKSTVVWRKSTYVNPGCNVAASSAICPPGYTAVGCTCSTQNPTSSNGEYMKANTLFWDGGFTNACTCQYATINTGGVVLSWIRAQAFCISSNCVNKPPEVPGVNWPANGFCGCDAQVPCPP